MYRRTTVVLMVVSLVSACGENEASDGGPSDAPTQACTGDADCDDGRFCNGAERCAPTALDADARGCAAGAPPCAASESCAEASAACVADECAEPDADGDGHDRVACGGDDCDDADGLRSPTAAEACDLADLDEDCDPTTFGGRDADSDGYVDIACCNGAACGDDCNDAVSGVHPLASEVCDGTDNDCDGAIDEGTQTEYFLDNDDDGHGQDGVSIFACSATGNYRALSGGDCDDATGAANPGAPEVCDGVDNDCDGAFDEWVTTTYYLDVDGDLFGVETETREACAPSGLYRATRGGDCDDERPGVNPGTAEACDGLDTDCDPSTWAVGEEDDADDVADVACGGTDCDDTRADVYPGAPELCDGRDNACDGGPVEDLDGDRFVAPLAICEGGPYPKTDCNDRNARVNPSFGVGATLGLRRYEDVPFCTDGLSNPCQRSDGTWTCLSGIITVCLGGNPAAVSWDWNCDGAEEAEPPFSPPATCASGVCSLGQGIGFCAANGYPNLCGLGGQGPTYTGSPPACGSLTPFAGCCCGLCGGPPLVGTARLSCR